MKTLATGTEITHAIHEVLVNQDDERIIIVAFVGIDPLRWIPTPKDLSLYCWPHAGATHPDGIAQLIDAGVDVHFVDRLHAKIFWSRTGGTVIGSANLSQNALGEKSLIEACIRLEPGQFQIQEVISGFEDKAIGQDNPEFSRIFEKLRTEHVAFCQWNPSSPMAQKVSKDRKLPTFGEWLQDGQRKAWQLSYFNSERNGPTDTDEKTGVPNALDHFEHFVGEISSEKLELHKPTLNFGILQSGWRLRKRAQLFWWYPSHSFKSSDLEWNESPYIWLCERLEKPNLIDPFDLNEPRFYEALNKCLAELGDEVDRLDGTNIEPVISSLAKWYSATAPMPGEVSYLG